MLLLQVVRTAGGQVWEDVTLLDWPDDDFRMFCGDLGNDVTDELLVSYLPLYSKGHGDLEFKNGHHSLVRYFFQTCLKDPGAQWEGNTCVGSDLVLTVQHKKSRTVQFESVLDTHIAKQQIIFITGLHTIYIIILTI